MIKEKFKLDRQVVERAYDNLSYRPERMAKYTIDAYAYANNRIIEYVQEKAADDRQKDAMQDIIDKLIGKHYDLTMSWINSLSRCASSAITGGSGFNVTRAEKRNDIAHEKEGKVYYFRDNFKKRIDKMLLNIIPKTERLDSELVEHQKKLDDAIKMHKIMKEINAFFRKEKDSKARYAYVESLGFFKDTDVIKDIVEPVYGGAGFAPYQLQLSNANIKRMTTRLKALQVKSDCRETGNKSVKWSFCEIVSNYDADRYQLIFDGKPPAEAIAILKRNGMRWSPRYTAWQRKITNNALWSLNNLILPELKKIYAEKES